MIVRRVVSSSSRVVSSSSRVVSSSSRVVSSTTYVIRKITNYILSEYKHKNFYLSKYHVIKEYIPYYTKNK
jgi:hypothetical protein